MSHKSNRKNYVKSIKNHIRLWGVFHIHAVCSQSSQSVESLFLAYFITSFRIIMNCYFIIIIIIGLNRAQFSQRHIKIDCRWQRHRIYSANFYPSKWCSSHSLWFLFNFLNSSFSSMFGMGIGYSSNLF